MFGCRYQAGAFIPEREDKSDDVFENPRTPRTPSGRPGSRATHIMVELDGKPQLTIDVFAGRWIVLAGPKGRPWLDAATSTAVPHDLDLQCHADALHSDQQWTAAYDVNDDGAVLIRPDGFVACRVPEGCPDSEATLREVLDRILRRNIAR
jgi:putative polyketide hydroxylase